MLYVFFVFSRIKYKVMRDVRVVVKATNFIEFVFRLPKLFKTIKTNNLYFLPVRIRTSRSESYKSLLSI